MLKINKFSKSYDGKVNVVENLDLEIKNGELFGLIGHNGAGKTTLIKAIVGIHSYEGSIQLDGVEIYQNQIACKKRMAYVADNPELYENLTGIQFLNFVCDIYDVKTDKRTQLITNYSQKLEFFNELNSQIKSYSHGMKQKLAIIASLVHEPDLIVLDEPFVGLDPKAAFIVKGIMKELCTKGKIILFSTHVLEVAQNLCDKIAIIKNGKIVVSGDTKELTKDQSLEDLFLEQLDETI